MFDIAEPVLVFDTQCHTRGGTIEGFIFGFYEPHAFKVRELYFATIIEAQLFAYGKRAALVMDANRTPARFTVLDFMLAAQEGDRVEILPAASAELREKQRKYAHARRCRLRYKTGERSRKKEVKP